jgi:SAM-dependent methyltransferase
LLTGAKLKTTTGFSPTEGQSELGAAKSCQICHNEAGNRIHKAREMMLGLRDEFRYLECQDCGCLQLLNPPKDTARYYPPDYGDFRTNQSLGPVIFQNVRRHLRERRNKGVLKGQSWLDRLLTSRYDYLQLKAFARIAAGSKARILDVGCGTGILLNDLKKMGYDNLLGVDRFVPQPMDTENGVRVLKGGLEDLIGTAWDVIMFHHSFEHMPDPAGVLQFAAGLLVPGGHCLIRIPVIGWAWQHYRVNWAQVDAPRHLFLHTEKSLHMLSDAAGLDMQCVGYDSNEFQFWVSELFMRDMTLVSVGMRPPRSLFSKATLREFRSRAVKLNLERRGDSAVFILVKS